MRYDVIIIGAGPGGIFSAYELVQGSRDLKVAVFEAGRPLEQRKCPIDGVRIKSCISCPSCAIMNGFGSQRVKGNVTSVLVGDNIIKVSLSVYDTDGLEGLYVPGSSFRETAKDVASGALSSNMNLNQGGYSNSFSQWGMQAIQNAYTRTTNAVSKSIKKNSAKLKYGTFVYLVNGKN